MKFRFRYHQLLNYRKALEDVAYADYAEAAQATRRAEEKLVILNESVTRAHQEIAEVKKRGGSPSEKLVRLDQFISGQKIRIQNLKYEIRQLKMREEELQDILRHRAIERKTLDKLREKQRVEWREELKKREGRVLDEIATMNHPRRRHL